MTQPNATADVTVDGVAQISGQPTATTDVSAAAGVVNMGALPYFYDPLQLVVTWLASLGIRAVTELPADLTGELPLVCVSLIGGGELNPAIEQVSIDIDAYVPPDPDGSPDPGAAADLSGRIRSELLYAMRGYTTPDGKATVVATSTVTRPAPRPYDQTAVRRNQAAYRLNIQSRD